MEGISLYPVLKWNEKSRKTPLFWEWSNGKAVMKDQLKTVCWGMDAPRE
jgi:hypothetical protein